MTVRLYILLVFVWCGNSLLLARNPKLLFNDSTLQSIRTTYNDPAIAFPFDGLKRAIVSSGSITKTLSSSGDAAGYDEEKAGLAKLLAFRYCIEANAGVALGDRSYYWLSTSSADDKYVYQADDWAMWMVNGLALTDYCIAFDMLCGAGYFDRANHPAETRSQAAWDSLKQATAQRLHDKAAAIYNRVKNFRTVGEAATALLVRNQMILNEAKFHAQVGNHRIMVASSLGVAALLLAEFGYSSEAALWLGFAKKDVEHFLLNRQRYPPIGSAALTVASQNVAGAFPEGIDYLNYSGLAFIPFFIANRLNGGEDYFQDPHYRQLMDWCYDLQMPDGSAPQINATSRGLYPINALSATVAADGAKYLGQLQRFVNSTSGGIGLPVEALCVIGAAASAAPILLNPVINRAVQGELIMRNDATTPSRYLLISAKHGAARYAAELHAYADAGSFIFHADGKTLVMHPGYAGYSRSKELENARVHNTVCPVVHDTINYDTPNRDIASPPAADAWITTSTHTEDFSYASVNMEVYGSKQVSSSQEAASLYFAAGSLSYDYGNSLHMTWKNNGEKYGTCVRRFLLVNNSYLVVRDDVVRTNHAMQYAVSLIQGNNGNNITSGAALSNGITTDANGERRWTTGGSDPVLRVNTASLGGKIAAYSTLEADMHQANDPALEAQSTEGKYFHAALKTGCAFTDNYAQMMSIMECDPTPSMKATATVQRNTDADSFLLYSVDGRGKKYGRYDVLFSQKQPRSVVLANTGLSFPIATDASFLAVSYGDTTNDTSLIKIFSNGATFVRSGAFTFVPNDSGEAQTSFTIKRAITAALGDAAAVPHAYALDQNYPNPFNPSTTIRFELPDESRVRIQIIDVLGRVVEEVVNGIYSAGWKSVQWNATTASGPYFYRIDAASTHAPLKYFARIRKLMVIK